MIYYSIITGNHKQRERTHTCVELESQSCSFTLIVSSSHICLRMGPPRSQVLAVLNYKHIGHHISWEILKAILCTDATDHADIIILVKNPTFPQMFFGSRIQLCKTILSKVYPFNKVLFLSKIWFPPYRTASNGSA